MGCVSSVCVVPWKKKKKKPCIPETVVFVPSMRIPVQSDLRRPIKGMIPKDLASRLHSLRNQIVLVSQDTGQFYSLSSSLRYSCLSWEVLRREMK